jgi:cytochrome P450
MPIMRKIDFRPQDPSFHADPFPIFRQMQEHDPVHYSPHLKSWVLTRYQDVKRVCQDQAYSSDRLRPFFSTLPSDEALRIAAIIRYLSIWMVFRDPPDHTRMRRLTGKVFNAKTMLAMAPQIQALTDWVIEQIGERQQIDFIADVAGPLPGLVIMAMLGVPREQLPLIKRLSDDMALFIGSSRTSAQKYATAERATLAMAGFFRELVEQRRSAPRADLITQLLQLRDGADQLSDDELIATCILLLFAGHETTTNHIANGMLALLRFPDQQEKLRADAALAAAAVEELLRYDGPSGAQVRVVASDQSIDDKT